MPHGPAVLTLLLQSVTCPRSVLFAIREVQSVVPFGSQALREAGRARELLSAPLDNSDGKIPVLADRLLGACDQIHAAIIDGWRGGWETA